MAKLYTSKPWLQRQRAAGLTPEDISKLAGVSRETIRRWMQKLGIK